MNVVSLIPFVYSKFMLFVLIYSRIAALFSTFILFRQDRVNVRIIVALTAILSYYVVFLGENTAIDGDVLSLKMISMMAYQMFIGFMAGLILNLVFEIFTASGQIISTQIGLSLSSLIDSRLGNITVLTQFYSFSILILFLMLNGHLMVIKMILDSFAAIPITQTLLSKNLFNQILNYSSIIFSGSILLSLTIIVAILVTNFSMALMSKFAPQFNLFSIGISLSLIIGLVCIYLTFFVFLDRGGVFIKGCLDFLTHLTQARLL